MSNIRATSVADSLRLHWRGIRQKVCALLPYIRRKKYQRLSQKFLENSTQLNQSITGRYALLDVIHDTLLSEPAPSKFANAAHIRQLVPLAFHPDTEICLFVTFCPDPELKPHVIDHVSALQAGGVEVVLIVNTDHSAEVFRFPEGFTDTLKGLILRENLGFDFAAWAHGYQLAGAQAFHKRLYLVNDSIVGPLSRPAFESLLEKVRASDADFIGLTENAQPCWHVQSFFLVLNTRILNSRLFGKLMHGVLNLPRKEDVIDCYEMRLAAFFTNHGFSCQVLFPDLTHDPSAPDDTLFRWSQLIERGFPYIKASVLAKVRSSFQADILLPARYR